MGITFWTMHSAVNFVCVKIHNFLVTVATRFDVGKTLMTPLNSPITTRKPS